MKNSLRLLFAFIVLLQLPVYAQTANLAPPKYFYGSNACDNSPYQLVFSEDFNGYDLDLSKWHKYTVWDGQETDNWEDSRKMDKLAIGLDQNVIVSNGTCKLILKKEDVSWRCATCTLANGTRPDVVHRGYTSGQISSYYTNKFRYGKFEARIKFPTHRDAWSTFWTWPAGNGNNDFPEIDIAESHGTAGSWAIRGTGDYSHVNHSTHRWLWNQFNPDNSNKSIEDGPHSYPNQGFWDWIHGNYFDQSDWHTYASEYDDMKVSFYVDGNLHGTRWRWETPVQYYFWGRGFTTWQASTCNPIFGKLYYENGNYPNVDINGSNLRFTHYIAANSIQNYGEAGRTEIDWVRVYQKHPELDGHTVICQNYPSITGPNYICANGPNPNLYHASVTSNSSWWTYSSNLTGMSGNASSGNTNIYCNANNVHGNEWVEFNYAEPGCPVKTVRKNVEVGTPLIYGAFSYLTTSISGWNTFYLNASTSSSASTTNYQWTLEYGEMNNGFRSPRGTVTRYGQYVQTPNFYSQSTKYIKWTLKATNACGSTTVSGYKSSGGSFSGLARTALTSDSDKYFSIDSYDSVALSERVNVRVSKEQFEFENDIIDSVKIESRINNIIIEELISTQFQLNDSANNSISNQSRLTNSNPIILPTYTLITPNPTKNSMQIRLAEGGYDIDIPVTVVVTDVLGKVWIDETIIGSIFKKFDVANMPSGIYIFDISQGKRRERLKLLKE